MWSNEGGKSVQTVRLIEGKKGKTILDALLVCILVTIMIGVSFHYYHKVVQEAREVALKAGLVNIRKTIQLYHFVERQYPADLEVLVRKRLMLLAREDTFFKEGYLSAVTIDPEGHPLDSFGNQYRYDPRNGRISSGTPGYETW